MKTRFVPALVSILGFTFFYCGCSVLEVPPDDVGDHGEPAQREEESRALGRLGDFDLIIHEHSNYRGRSEQYTLGENQRHLIVNFVGWGLNDRISSFELGRGVGVAFFRDRDLRGPVAVYNSSSALIDSDINDKISSLILFDLDRGGPLGVWIGERANPDDIFNFNFGGKVRFYPMPQQNWDREASIGRLDDFNDNVEWVVIGPVDRNDYRRGDYRGRYSNRWSRGAILEVTVYEHANYRGRSIILPPRNGRGSVFRMKDFNFDRMASSLRIRQVR